MRRAGLFAGSAIHHLTTRQSRALGPTVAGEAEDVRRMAPRIFPYPSLAPGALCGLMAARRSAPDRELPAPLCGPGRVHLYFWGRNAIWNALRVLNLSAGDSVLLPAYHCGSEVDPFIKGRIAVQFYPLNDRLEVDLDSVRKLLTSRTRALFITHYFGFPQSMEPIVSFCKNRGIRLIEDCAHALFGRQNGRDLGTFGDVAIFSVRKTLPTPGGGALLINDRDLADPPSSSPPSVAKVLGLTRCLLQRHLEARYGGAGQILSQRAIEPAARLAKRIRKAAGCHTGAATDADPLSLDPEQASWRISRLAVDMLRGAEATKVRRRRNLNFQFLLDELRLVRSAKPVFDSIEEGVSPLFFPLIVDDPWALQRRLSAHGIEAMVFWSYFHEALPKEQHPQAVYLKRHVLALPVHQELSEGELARVAEEVQRCLS